MYNIVVLQQRFVCTVITAMEDVDLVKSNIWKYGLKDYASNKPFYEILRYNLECQILRSNYLY